jgi:hypothetical protein
VAHAAASSTTAISQSHALLLAGRCLRQHGLPNLPDPTIATSGPHKGQAILDKQALLAVPYSVFSQALLACNAPLSQAGFQGGNAAPSPRDIQDLLAFARCVRNHGISNFPDPNSQGGFNLAGTGINSHQLSSTQLAVARTCLPKARGAIDIPSQGAVSSSNRQ